MTCITKQNISECSSELDSRTSGGMTEGEVEENTYVSPSTIYKYYQVYMESFINVFMTKGLFHNGF